MNFFDTLSSCRTVSLIRPTSLPPNVIQKRVANSGITETNIFVHLFSYKNHIKLKESKKPRSYDYNYYPRLFLHTDTAESIFYQTFQSNYLFCTDKIIDASLLILFSLFSFIFILLTAIPSELHQKPEKEKLNFRRNKHRKNLSK